MNVGRIGARTPLVDGPDKVAGKALFSADFQTGALVGAILRGTFGHAELLDVDTGAARAMPGVRAVITGADCDVPFGVLPIAENEFPLARERVRYRGEPIAAVAAVDAKTARAALDAIKISYREMPV